MSAIAVSSIPSIIARPRREACIAVRIPPSPRGPYGVPRAVHGNINVLILPSLCERSASPMTTDGNMKQRAYSSAKIKSALDPGLRFFNRQAFQAIHKQSWNNKAPFPHPTASLPNTMNPTALITIAILAALGLAQQQPCYNQ